MNESNDAFEERLADELKSVAESLRQPADLDRMIAARHAARRRRQTAGRVVVYSIGCVLVIGAVVWVRQVRSDTAPASQPVPTEVPDTLPTASTVIVPPTDTTLNVMPTFVDASAPIQIATSTTQLMPDLPEAGDSTSEVSVDDPLPVQVDGAADPVEAETAVRYAYEHWILVDLDKDLRGRIVENGEQHADLMATNFAAARDAIGMARIAVDSVTFLDAEHADVGFHVMYGDQRSPIFPDDMVGAALFQNGSWRITSRSLCLLAFNVGEGCSGQYPDSPASPLALKLDPVPDGFVRQGPAAPADVLAVGGGGGVWIDQTTGQQFSIAATSLAGVSTLSGDDAVAVLDRRAPLGDAAAVDVTVGDRPGRGYQIGQTAAVSFIRADDVIVQMMGNVTIDQLVAVAESLQPTDEVPAEIVANPSVPVETGD